MVINRIKPSGLIFLFTLIGFAGVALGNPQPPLVFVPSTADYNGTHGEFFGTSTWTHTVGAAGAVRTPMPITDLSGLTFKLCLAAVQPRPGRASNST